MKLYVKPSVDVVELSVKETIADLPVGVTVETKNINGQSMTLTTYNLAAVETSDEA